MDSASTSRSHSRDPSHYETLFQRSINAVSDVLSPFSAAAVATLPKLARPQRYLRADAIPDTHSNGHGEMPTVRDYHAINLPPQVRIPKKIATPVKVEPKVWFANERTWVAWLNISILIGTLAIALFNASKDEIATRFACTYAFISVAILVYAYALYQYRISMIRRRDPGHFDAIAGPVVVGVVLFTAILANFIVRVRELKRKEIPIPGENVLGPLLQSIKPFALFTQSP